jgi:hypothetical protein
MRKTVITRGQWKRFRELNSHADIILNRVNHKPITVIMDMNPAFIRKFRQKYENYYSITVVKEFDKLLEVIQSRNVDLIILSIDSENGNWFDRIRRLKIISPKLNILFFSKSYLNVNAIESAQPVDAIYKKLKNRIANNINHDICNGILCRYSILFNQYNGVIVNSSRLDSLSVREIGYNNNILPLCEISKKLEALRKDDGRRICPFLQDINPKSKPKKYNIGRCSSYRCGYYDFAAINPDHAIPARTELIPRIENASKPVPVSIPALSIS